MKQDEALRKATQGWLTKGGVRLPSNFTFRVMQQIQAEELRRERCRRRKELLVMLVVGVFSLCMMLWLLGAELKAMLLKLMTETQVSVVVLTSLATVFFCLLDTYLSRKFKTRL